ncbi:hypothetical protein [Pararhodospirillum photometricum]|nr:hypothetical protein [Pararhodospirillum photometricum]
MLFPPAPLRSRLLMGGCLGLSLLVAGGCARDSAVKPITDLSLACATTPCTCTSTTGGFFTNERTQPPEWTADGRATCPAGFALRRTVK